MDAASSARRPAPRDDCEGDSYVLEIAPGVSPRHVADRLGIRYLEALPLHGHHLFCARKADYDIVEYEIHELRRKRDAGAVDILDNVLLSDKQQLRQRVKRTIPPLQHTDLRSRKPLGAPVPQAVNAQTTLMQTLNIYDPIFRDQWHLFNTISPGHDVNATGLWLEGITGSNVTVAIIDDGLDMYSDDLKANYFADGSYDFNSNKSEPKPQLSDDKHGTRCAGEVAAVRNNVCGVGVAYDARVAGIRILSGPISDADESKAMLYQNQHNQIYSCSWGPPDDGRSMDAPGILIRRAILEGIQQGRGGLGSLFVFASGNGAASGDNCNFDGYTNSIFSITVGAVDRVGEHPYYSELCSAQLVVTYSSGHADHIHTTDVGTNACTTTHGGTSAAAPLAAGIFALAMQVRPDLTWRDFQYLAMDTALPVSAQADSWQTTAIGKRFSHYFGYGKIDSYALVQKAKSWVKVKPQAWLFSPWVHVRAGIPEGSHGLITSLEITDEMMRKENLARIEHVTVTMFVNHTRRGDLSVDLISPARVVSHIATARPQDDHNGGYDGWTFMSVVHWGELGVGTWNLVVRDVNVNAHNGTLIDWRLKLWGEAIDAKKAYPLPMPNTTDDNDHDRITSTVTGPVETSPLGPPGELPTSISLPTDHPERPTKPGPLPTSSAPGAAPTGPGVPPGFSPGKPGPIWIYGAFCLIIVFCIALGSWLWIARRRRLRNQARDNYEFELIDEEELEALEGGEKDGGGGRKGRRTRGGELYDAFAGGSDDEDDAVDKYRDQSSERLVGSDEAEAEAEQYVVGEETDDGDDNSVAGDQADARLLERDRR
ncbi:hypothetical protein CDD83_10157 [Cordyceps sp. RAO-2017]|nr:hypothetical protein CDD83_10157 [Cordyceps sp. RAO-2017]